MSSATPHPADPLPAAIESLIARVVRRARLRLGERADVERELRSHFAAGLEEGKSAEELIAGFGDARAAGKMIGRAKRRCRGLVWQMWVWSCRGVAALFALVVVTYAWAAWGYYGAEPTITRNFLKEMNAKIEAIPEEDRAWPWYRQAMLSLPTADRDRLYTFHWDLADEAPPAGLRDFLARYRATIDLTIRGSMRPALGQPISGDEEIERWWGFKRSPAARWWDDPTNPPLLAREWPAPYLGNLEELLSDDARVAMSDGDSARWSLDVHAGIHLARQVGQTPSFVGYLMGLNIDRRFGNRVAGAIAMYPERIDDDELDTIMRELNASMAWKRDIPFGLAKQDAEDAIQRLYNSSTGRITAAGVAWIAAYYKQFLTPGVVHQSNQMLEPPILLGPVNAMVIAPRSEMLERVSWVYDTWDQEARTPLLERGEDKVRAWSAKESDLAIIGSRWWPLFVNGASGFSIDMRDRAMQETEALQVVIAIEQFRRRAGRVPTSLDELVPEYMTRIPIDIYSGEALRYVVKEGIPIVYSVGCDMDDDGASETKERIGRYASGATEGPPRKTNPEWWTEERIRDYDGDWILWPWFDPDAKKFIAKARTP